MNPLDKLILSKIYVHNLLSENFDGERLEDILVLNKDLLDERVLELKKLGFIESSYSDNGNKLTFLGRDAIKVVLVGGVFDVLHPGHIYTLKAAKSYGDVLVVVIATTQTALKIKKERKIYHDENLRKELVSSLKFVDVSIIGKEGTLFDTVEVVRPDIIALGYDQSHNEKEIALNCEKRNLNVRVVRLNTPIPGSKSSQIKIELGDQLYGI